MIGIKLSKQLTLAKIHFPFECILLAIYYDISSNSRRIWRKTFKNFSKFYVRIQIRKNSNRFKRIASITDYRSPFYLCLSLSVPRRSKVENVNVANNSNLAGWSSTTYCVHSRRCSEFKRGEEDLSLSLSPKELVYGVVAIHYHRHEPEWLGSLSRRMY